MVTPESKPEGAPLVSSQAAELLDVLDEHGLPTGETKPRGLVHRDGDWHRAVHVWLVRENGDVVLQRRSANKKIEPLKLDVSVGGHLQAGELDIDAVREVEEEVGLFLKPGALHHLLTLTSERHYPGVVDREFQEVYVVRDDTPLSHYVLKPDEVEVVYEVPLTRALALFESGAHLPAPGYDAMRRVNNALLVADDLPSQGSQILAEELRAVADWHQELHSRPNGTSDLTT